MKIRSKIAMLSVATSLFITSNSFAKNNDEWIVRLRGVYVKTDVSSKISGIGGHIATSSDVIPELDFTRFFTPNIAAELILGTTEHNVRANGTAAGNLPAGSVRLLPPTLTAQYHFNPKGTFRPYAGAGLNYTFFYNAKAVPGQTVTSVKYQDHLGYALQLGLDYMLTDSVGVNFDIKKIFLATNVQINNSYTAKVKLDPWLIGAGVSYHF